MAKKDGSKFITNDIALFIRIQENLKKYSFLKPNDCIVDPSKNRYIVSSVDEHGIIWIKQILASGKVSDTEKTFADWYSPKLKIEEGQIDCILLGADYDPAKDVKEVAKIKSAIARRNKLKAINFKKMTAAEIEIWIANNISIGKRIWMDTEEYEVTAIKEIDVQYTLSTCSYYNMPVNRSMLDLYVNTAVKKMNVVELKNVKYVQCTRTFNNHFDYYKIYLEKPEEYSREQH